MVRKRKTKSETRSRVCEEDVDRISGLSDDLLVKILSFLPTRVAVSTSILSRRWECLWMWLPKLKFDSGGSVSANNNLVRFLDLNMPLHRAPVIESFNLRLHASSLSPLNIQLWLVTPLSRHLRELEVTYLYPGESNILPSSLYTCKSLVILKLGGEIRLNVPRLGCLPSLKTLEIQLYYHLQGKSLRRLLSVCPVLENLVVYCDKRSDDTGLITVTVPSLQRLSLHMPSDPEGVLDGLLLDTPSLKYLKLEDIHDRGRHSFSIEAMPDLEEAYVDLKYHYTDVTGHGHIGSVTSIERLMSSITSVKRLTICLEFLYGDGLVFNQLEHLKLCVHTRNLPNLLARFLEDSPNLRVLDFFEMDHDDMHWEKSPTSYDDSIESTLQAFDWPTYFERRPQEMDLAVYILGEKWSLEDCSDLD